MSGKFYEDGYLIAKNENLEAHKLFSETVRAILEVEDLSLTHKSIPKSKINEARLSAFKALNSLHNFKDLYFSQAETIISEMIGSDISIQKKLNLSIQMPGDETSLLRLHTDTLSGQSPFEVVLWTPLTKCADTNSMFLIGKHTSQIMMNELCNSEKSIGQLEKSYESKKVYLDLSETDILLFSPTLFHGNNINQTHSTRVSINCRFKNIFSPESSNPERRLGTFYELFKVSDLSKIGLDYSDSFWST